MDPSLSRDLLEALWVVLGSVLAYAILRHLLRRRFAAARARRRDREGAERQLAYLSDLERWLTWALRALAVLAAAVGLLRAFGVAEAEVVAPALSAVRAKGLRVAVIIFLALLANRALKFLVGQFSACLHLHGEPSRDQEARVQTVCGVLTGGGTVAILVVAGFLVLETVLDSVGTVLACVGFLGIAVGFGAQTLVRDLVSGFFILLENQLAVGDGARINDLWGTVERIGLRTITLRDSEGVAHIIPNGGIDVAARGGWGGLAICAAPPMPAAFELTPTGCDPGATVDCGAAQRRITRVSNATKGWSRAVVHAGTDYSTDPDKALAVLREVAREVGAEPRFRGALLRDLEVTGPEAFDDTVLYRISGATHPRRQWEVMRDLRYRIWKAFAREGIALKKAPNHSAAGRVD